MKLTFFLALFVLTILTSCKCRKGYDEIYYYYATTINHIESRESGYNYYTELEINSLVRKEDGNRCSPHLDLRTSNEESIDSNSISLYSDKALVNDKMTIPAGENILDYRDAFQNDINFDFGSVYGRLSLRLDTTIRSATLTYYISGITSLGNSFIDSTKVTYN